MSPLHQDLRSRLERSVLAAREAAEAAARAALEALAVNQGEPFPSLGPEQRALRNRLRARARQLGDGSQTRGFEPLVLVAALDLQRRLELIRDGEAAADGKSGYDT